MTMGAGSAGALEGVGLATNDQGRQRQANSFPRRSTPGRIGVDAELRYSSIAVP